jgi:plastocyanin
MVSGLGVGLVLAVATACGGSNSTQPTQAPPAQASQSGPTCGEVTGGDQAVAISNFSFNPGTVTLGAGSTVTWANSDSTTHTVTFDAGPDCGNVPSGAGVSATFGSAGPYAYHCTIHPSMRGTVTVS